jgi:DNA-binding NarL/FixJ family response regulator
MKIILADDHALFREGARHLLQQLSGEDIQVLEAATCQEAIAHADQHEDVDLALLDLHMRRAFPDGASGSAGGGVVGF